MIKRKGFTLIELIIVMSIMAILASCLIPNYSYYVDKSKKECIKSEGNEIFQVITLSYENNNCEISEVQMENDLKDILNEDVSINKIESNSVYLVFNYNNIGYKMHVDLSLYKYDIVDVNKGEIICEEA